MIYSICGCDLSIVRLLKLADSGHKAKQKKSLHSGTVAHVKNTALLWPWKYHQHYYIIIVWKRIGASLLAWKTLLISSKSRERKHEASIDNMASGDSKRGGLGGPWPPQIFAWPPVWPPHFFPNFPLKFFWLTYARLPNVFFKNTGHFVNSARSALSKFVSSTGKTETISIVKPQLIIFPYFGWFVTFQCVWRENRTYDCVNSSK